MTALSPAAAGIGSAEFRHAIGHFATGVTVVTSVGLAGEPVGTTANAVSSLSLDPPLILVCFDRASTTLDAIVQHGAFAVLPVESANLEVEFRNGAHRPPLGRLVVRE